MLEVWPKNVFRSSVRLGVLWSVLSGHDWWLLAQLDPSGASGERFSVFLKLKNEPCKIVKNIVKYRVLGSGEAKLEPKRAPKVVLFLLPKSYKNLLKHRVSARSPQQKNKPENKFRFFVKKRFCITHGFVSVKLMFRSVNERLFLHFWLIFLGFFLGPNLACYTENHEKTL